MEYRLRRHDGDYRWILDFGVPIFESNGAFRGYIGSCVDITDRKQSEEMLLETTGRLAEANQQIAKLNERLERENVYLKEEVKLDHSHSEVIGDSVSVQRVLQKAEQVAPTDSTVLLLGETGTGKELIARTIHDLSRRKGRLMVKVNCAALPASLVESELFGREKGAFTGALTREIGRFELANGSTILLDEIGELPVELQSKLLRVLQEGEFERLGGPKTIKVDVRVIAATSRNLQLAVREGKFREDLFYRLNVFPITIPPLRERRDDIPPLVWHFVNELSQRMGRSIETIHGSTMEAFKNYPWPGNVRELRNLIERLLISSTFAVFRGELPSVDTDGARAHTLTFEEVERNHFLHIMEMVGWRVRGEGGAAQILGLKPTTLESRMQKLGIARQK
jgi:formate hydrogenlyase transcriptional activator